MKNATIDLNYELSTGYLLNDLLRHIGTYSEDQVVKGKGRIAASLALQTLLPHGSARPLLDAVPMERERLMAAGTLVLAALRFQDDEENRTLRLAVQNLRQQHTSGARYTTGHLENGSYDFEACRYQAIQDLHALLKPHCRNLSPLTEREKKASLDFGDRYAPCTEGRGWFNIAESVLNTKLRQTAQKRHASARQERAEAGETLRPQGRPPKEERGR